MPSRPPTISTVELRVPTPPPGQVTEVRVSVRRVSPTPAGPGLAAPALETHGEPVEDWAEVVSLADRRRAS